jgi:hypothetical protein
MGSLKGVDRGGAHSPKIDRSAFAYIPAKEGNATGQCKSCPLWVSDENLCIIHGPKVEVRGGDSCVFYLPGKPTPGAPTDKIVTPQESGLVSRQVRCENCRFEHSSATVCGLYETLNHLMPETFHLDAEIEPQGCCNAQLP